MLLRKENGGLLSTASAGRKAVKKAKQIKPWLNHGNLRFSWLNQDIGHIRAFIWIRESMDLKGPRVGK